MGTLFSLIGMKYLITLKIVKRHAVGKKIMLLHNHLQMGDITSNSKESFVPLEEM